MNKRSTWVDYLLILAGTGLMAVAINVIYDPNGLVTGGFTGIAIIAKEMTGPLLKGGIPLWLTNLCLNIPVFLLAAKIKGVRYIGRTLFATVALSAWLYVIPVFSLMIDDLVLASLFGGVISGIGMGLVFLARATTGGTDMVAALIQHYLPHYTIAQIMQVVDALVVLVGAYVFGISKALYAVIAIFVVSRMSDGIIEGLKFSKAAFIITERQKEVSDMIMSELDRGLTGVPAKGMYSGADKLMLFCVVSKKEIVQLKQIVVKMDPNAFVIVTDAREVLGEGFLEVHL
ncbi:YitT family protein [Diplocloster modestus]|uniref:YitT family protein n=1 Tax=Diplocloster modestus TaxID=2850322 RepID=A0ABS6KDG6_9FIRM|nr:YitT family protein [Diplocloster modestus]MBU9728543.1 YitT family protein [Diplocloster modestus]